MEKIFKRYRYTIHDDGFSEGVMDHINDIGRPSRKSYRMPTLVAAMATVVIITILTLTVGLDTMNEEYLRLSQAMIHQNSQYYDNSEDEDVTNCDYESFDDKNME